MKASYVGSTASRGDCLVSPYVVLAVGQDSRGYYLTEILSHSLMVFSDRSI